MSLQGHTLSYLKNYGNLMRSPRSRKKANITPTKYHTHLQERQEGVYFSARTLLGAQFGTNEAAFEEQEGIQQRTTSHRAWEKTLRQQGLFCLKKRRRIRKLIAIFH